MAVNRKTVRGAFATLLQTAIVGTGKPAQALYAYRPADFAGQSPVVTVSSSGSRRKSTTRLASTADVYLQVGLFVLYSDNATWNPDDSEDALDDLEAALATVMEQNQSATYWYSLDYSDRSQRMDVMIGGQEYAFEPVEVIIRTNG